MSSVKKSRPKKSLNKSENIASVKNEICMKKKSNGKKEENTLCNRPENFQISCSIGSILQKRHELIDVFLKNTKEKGYLYKAAKQARTILKNRTEMEIIEAERSLSLMLHTFIRSKQYLGSDMCRENVNELGLDHFNAETIIEAYDYYYHFANTRTIDLSKEEGRFKKASADGFLNFSLPEYLALFALAKIADSLTVYFDGSITCFDENNEAALYAINKAIEIGKEKNQHQLSDDVLKSINVGEKVRTDNQYFAGKSARERARIAEEKWKPYLDEAEKVVSEKPCKKTASAIADIVLKRLKECSETSGIKKDTLRKKIGECKNIKPFLKKATRRK